MNKNYFRRYKFKLSFGLFIFMFLCWFNVSGQEKYQDHLASYKLVKIDERTIKISESTTPFNRYDRRINTYTLDVLTVEHLISGNTFKFLYPGDLTWDVGDKYNIAIKGHLNWDESWTDDEIVDFFMTEISGHARTPNQTAEYMGIVSGFKKIKE